MSMMRDRAGRAPVAAPERQAVGRHERRPRRFAGQARRWWTDGTDRVTARAHERWSDRVAGARRGHLVAGLGHRGEDLVAGWCSLLVVLGLYLDGWSHRGLEGDASRPFLTPWHAVLYAGFAGTAAWILSQGQRRGAWSLFFFQQVSPAAAWRQPFAGTMQVYGLLAPAVYWTAHFTLLGAGYGAPWEPRAVGRSVLWASLSGFTLALLMWPPAVPLTAWNRGRSATARIAAARSPATPASMPTRMVGR